jgi:hypothetical protein
MRTKIIRRIVKKSMVIAVIFSSKIGIKTVLKNLSASFKKI